MRRFPLAQNFAENLRANAFPRSTCRRYFPESVSRHYFLCWHSQHLREQIHGENTWSVFPNAYERSGRTLPTAFPRTAETTCTDLESPSLSSIGIPFPLFFLRYTSIGLPRDGRTAGRRQRPSRRPRDVHGPAAGRCAWFSTPFPLVDFHTTLRRVDLSKFIEYYIKGTVRRIV